MHLLVVSTWFPFPPTNGSKLRAFHLLQELAKSHSVHLLTFAEPGEETGLSGLVPIVETVRIVSGNPAKAPARLGFVGLMSRTPRAYLRGYSAEMQHLVDTHASKCATAIALELPASLYLRCARLPRLLEQVEVSAITQKMAHAKGLSRLRHQLTVTKLAGFARRLTHEFDHVTVVSENERQALIGLGCKGDKISVVPNGADPRDLERPIGITEPTTLVHPGSLTYSANFDAVRWFLSEVWPIVSTRCPKARFVVTGSTQNVDLAGLPQRSGVEFTGFVDDVKSVIARSAACVVPLRLGGGTRLKVLESLALGTPVVATSKAVEGLDVTPDTHVLVGNTAEEFANHVLRVLNDPLLADRLRASGRQLIESRYTWPRIAALLNDRLTQIARRR